MICYMNTCVVLVPYVFNTCVLHYGVCTPSVQFSMIYMENCYTNEIISS